MRIGPDDLSDGALRYAGTLAAPATSIPDDIDLGAPIAFAVTIDLENDRLRLLGWLHCVPRVPCARCLEAVPIGVERDIDLTYVPASGSPGEPDQELDANDLDVDYYSDAGLELASVLAEQVLLDLPMKPLCRDSCRGICPQCGTNRNLQACECEPAGDPRMSPLSALRKRL